MTAEAPMSLPFSSRDKRRICPKSKAVAASEGAQHHARLNQRPILQLGGLGGCRREIS
jgi:hypothetical protein